MTSLDRSVYLLTICSLQCCDLGIGAAVLARKVTTGTAQSPECLQTTVHESAFELLAQRVIDRSVCVCFGYGRADRAGSPCARGAPERWARTRSRSPRGHGARRPQARRPRRPGPRARRRRVGSCVAAAPHGNSTLALDLGCCPRHPVTVGSTPSRSSGGPRRRCAAGLPTRLCVALGAFGLPGKRSAVSRRVRDMTSQRFAVSARNRRRGTKAPRLRTTAAMKALASGCATPAPALPAHATSASSGQPEPRRSSAEIEHDASTRLASPDDSVHRLHALPFDVPAPDRPQQRAIRDQRSDDELDVAPSMHLVHAEAVGP